MYSYVRVLTYFLQAINYQSVFRIYPSYVICYLGIDARSSCFTTSFNRMYFSNISESVTLISIFDCDFDPTKDLENSSLSYSPGCDSVQSEFSVDLGNKWTTRFTLASISSHFTTTNHVRSEPVL